MRSREDAQKLADVMKTEIEATPENNIFGESNDEDMKLMIEQLEDYAASGIVIDMYCEVTLWIHEKSSILGDYDV